MSETARAPWHLWLVGILALLWNGFGTLDFTASALRFEPYMSNVPPAMLEHIYAQPMWLWAAWGVGTWGGLIGSALLLLRNKFAVIVLAFSFVGATGSQAPGIIAPPLDIGAPPFLPWIIIAISALLLAYAFWLSKRGVLR